MEFTNEVSKREFNEIKLTSIIGPFLLFLMSKYEGQLMSVDIGKERLNNFSETLQQGIDIAREEKDFKRASEIARFKNCFKKHFFKPKYVFYPSSFSMYFRDIEDAFENQLLLRQLIEMHQIINEK